MNNMASCRSRNNRFSARPFPCPAMHALATMVGRRVGTSKLFQPRGGVDGSSSLAAAGATSAASSKTPRRRFACIYNPPANRLERDDARDAVRGACGGGVQLHRHRRRLEPRADSTIHVVGPTGSPEVSRMFLGRFARGAKPLRFWSTAHRSRKLWILEKVTSPS